MKIIYIARHNRGDNDDEGAIRFALEELGHEVVCIPEKQAARSNNLRADFILCHHLDDVRILHRAQTPSVFWCFDEVDGKDPSIRRRSNDRIKWINSITQAVMLGICTDGDWVAQDKTGKLRHLTQGVDARRAGPGRPVIEGIAPIIFTGMATSGNRRASHIEELQAIYKDDFQVRGNVAGRVHGRELADVFASTEIVIAPDSPGTDRYWSNRVYLTLGLGGFLIHPYCRMLAEQFEPDKELVYYHSRAELCEKIDYYRAHPVQRRAIQQAGLWRALREHTYRHRCETLLKWVTDALPGRPPRAVAPVPRQSSKPRPQPPRRPIVSKQRFNLRRLR